MSRKPLSVKRGRDLTAEPPPSTLVPMSTSPHVSMSPRRKVRRNGTRKKSFYLPDDLVRALGHHCTDEDVSESEVAIVALRKYLGVR